MFTMILKVAARILRRGVTGLIKLAAVAGICYVIVVDGPQVYGMHVRRTVGNSVVLIVVPEGKMVVTGTGFHVRAPNGKTVLISNRHVCAHSADGTIMAFGEKMGQPVKLKILKLSTDSDLCMAEAVAGYDPLPIGSSLAVGDRVITAGHPESLPLTIAYGQVVGAIEGGAQRSATPQEVKDKKCRWKDSKFLDDPEEPGQKICVETARTVVTTAQVEHGSSGSPLLNRYGQVVGVVMSSMALNYSGAVPLSQLKRFLNGS